MQGRPGRNLIHRASQYARQFQSDSISTDGWNTVVARLLLVFVITTAVLPQRVQEDVLVTVLNDLLREVLDLKVVEFIATMLVVTASIRTSTSISSAVHPIDCTVTGLSHTASEAVTVAPNLTALLSYMTQITPVIEVVKHVGNSVTIGVLRDELDEVTQDRFDT